MKKIFAIVSSLFLVSIVTAKAEIGIGISGAVHSFDASGSETTRTSIHTAVVYTCQHYDLHLCKHTR